MIPSLRVLLLPLLFLLCSRAGAQPDVPRERRSIEGGREYWMTFQRNFRGYRDVSNGKFSHLVLDSSLRLSLSITSAVMARGYAEIAGSGHRVPFTVPAGEMITIPIDPAALVESSDTVERRAVHLVADAPVIVYGTCHRYQSTETFIAYPVEDLGNSYRASCFGPLDRDLTAQVALVGTEDGTRVTITPTAGIARTVPTGLAITFPRSRLSASDTVRRGAPQRKPGRNKRRRLDSLVTAVLSRVDSSTTQEVMMTFRQIDTVTVSRPASLPYTIVLNRGDVYQLIARSAGSYTAIHGGKDSADLTGTSILSDRPIAVFSGHICAYVPDPSAKACNLLVEQLPPADAWGRTFYVADLARHYPSLVRVTASRDSTHIHRNGTLVATLGAGRFYQQRLDSAEILTADFPVLVAQIGYGSRGLWGDGVDTLGDPMMLLVAPVEQYASAYRFMTPEAGSWHSYITVLAPTASLGSLRLDGISIDTGLFRRFSDGLYSRAAVAVDRGAHFITGSSPFGLYLYGFGYGADNYDAYGNAGGYMIPDSGK
ncbi:MAG: hypothetical protein JWQ98_2983 [Chlorobi bacterium]|nr:hypothetical protein [Chlorobiota bacterium]